MSKANTFSLVREGGAKKKALVWASSKVKVHNNKKKPPVVPSNIRLLQDVEACMEHLAEEVHRLSYMILEIQSVAEVKKLQ